MRGVGSRIRWWQGLYVRVNIGNTSSGERRYLVCEVLGIRDKATEYQVPTPLSVCEVMSKRRALGPVLGARGSCAPCDAGCHSGREGRLGEGRLAVTRGSCDSRVSASVRIPCVAFAPQCPHHSPAQKLLRDAAKGRRLESWRKRLARIWPAEADGASGRLAPSPTLRLPGRAAAARSARASCRFS